MQWHLLTWYSISAFPYCHAPQPHFQVTHCSKYELLSASTPCTLCTMILGKHYGQQWCKLSPSFPSLSRDCFHGFCLLTTAFVHLFLESKSSFRLLVRHEQLDGTDIALGSNWILKHWQRVLVVHHCHVTLVPQESV